MRKNSKVAILGVGMMGPGIAACSALAGHPTVLIGRNAERAAHGVQAACANIRQLLEHDLVGPQQAEEGCSLLSGSRDFAGSCRAASLIIEAVSEDLPLKQKIFKEIDEESKLYALNLKLPFDQWSGNPGYFKTGVFRDQVDRVFDQDTFSNFGDSSVSYEGGWDDPWSSHFGDEFLIANPSALNDRINYVRNEIVLGASYYPEPWMRLYGEVGYSFYCDGGSEPWEVQFGTELSRPGPTGANGSPFLAINGNLRQEVDWGGDVSTQAGWLWRNETGQVMRLGLHYFNGKSSQFETFSRFEQQIGFGLWYDF